MVSYQHFALAIILREGTAEGEACHSLSNQHTAKAVSH